jgi:glycosyltransferase involved in cell wall biosynthesis
MAAAVRGNLPNRSLWYAPAVRTSGSDPAPARTGPRVLRISHSAVVTAWRQRERLLRAGGVDLTLVTASQWDEGGALVPFTSDGDTFARSARTFGRHPNLFVFDPRPLWKLLGDGSWDLIDMHEEPFGLAVAEVLVLRALRGRKTPYLVSSAQNLMKRYPPPFRWFERWSLQGAAGAYTCNAEAGQILRRKGLTGQLELLPLGVDTERFRPADRPSPGARLRVGFVGRLIPVKGIDVLLRALAMDDRLDLEIYGGGPEDASLRSLAAELGVAERVRFHGHVDEAALVDVYPSFDVLAVPSVLVPNVLEQFGRVVVEGQACGVPVVASDCGALPDVVDDAGLLVPPGDAPALSAALSRFLDEPGLWERLRAKGLENVGRYSWASVAAQQQAFYERALAAV